MPPVLDTINRRFAPAVALDTVDANWETTMQRSLFGRAWAAVRGRANGMFSSAANVGSVLQQVGFVIVAGMMLILAAPQFANDKEGLALLVAGAYGLRLIGTLLAGREKYKPSAIDGIVLLFFAINIIASFGSHYVKESLFGLAKLVVYVFAYFLFVWCFQTNTNKRCTITLSSLVLGGLLVSLYGLYQYKIGVQPLATWEDPTVEDKATRIFSTLGNPNLLAGYLIPLIPISFSLTMISLFTKGWKRLFALPFLAATGIITIATFLTGSRGAYIALGCEGAALLVVATIWLWREYPKYRLLLVAGLLLLPLAAVAVLHFALPSFEHRFMSIFQGSQHSSNAYRMNVWRASFAMFKDNWWIGIGSGNKTFRLAYGLYMRSGFDALGTYCVPLEVAVETGILGLLAFMWLLIAVAARAHCRFWLNTSTTQRWLALGSIAAIVGMMGHGLVDTVFYRPQVQFIFWLAISLLVALPTESEARKE